MNLSKNQKIMAGVAVAVVAYLVYRQMKKQGTPVGVPSN